MSNFNVPEGYETLTSVFVQAIEQAAYGKGKERHQVGDTPFDHQPICEIGRMVGYQGDLFQAIKKMQEATRLSPDRPVREILGALNYGAAAVLLIQEQNGGAFNQVEKGQPEPDTQADANEYAEPTECGCSSCTYRRFLNSLTKEQYQLYSQLAG